MLKLISFNFLILLILLPFLNCQDQGPPEYPYKAFTPGNVLTTVSLEFCQPGWAGKHRNVTQLKKSKVYKEYNVTNFEGYCECPEGCEIDHLIPLEIGGSNEITNLWPQPFCGDWNAHTKDILETKLHNLICSNKLDTQVAQNAIATDWIQAYNKYVH
jgi:hypothetical protein